MGVDMHCDLSKSDVTDTSQKDQCKINLYTRV